MPRRGQAGGKGAFSFEVRGLVQMEQALRRIQNQFKDEIPRALREEGERIMTISKQEFVPVDTGNLRASGTVSDARRVGRDVVVDLFFGGPAAPYALEVHENVDAGHRVGSAKYLEIPLNAAIPGMLNRISRRLKI